MAICVFPCPLCRTEIKVTSAALKRATEKARSTLEGLVGGWFLKERERFECCVCVTTKGKLRSTGAQLIPCHGHRVCRACAVDWATIKASACARGAESLLARPIIIRVHPSVVTDDDAAVFVVPRHMYSGT
jgi:hypothetical protein